MPQMGMVFFSPGWQAEKSRIAVKGAKKAPLWKGAMPARIASGYSFQHI